MGLLITAITTMKILTIVFFFISFIYSVKNYRLTKYSNIWIYASLATCCAFILSIVRTIKEFWPLEELEIIKIELVPLFIAFILVATIAVRKERRVPVITPVMEEDGGKKVSHCGIDYGCIHVDTMKKQKETVDSGKRRKCPVRQCVEERQIDSCLLCPKYPDCHIRRKSIDRCELLTFKLEKGHLYLKEEERSTEGFNVFVNGVMYGLRGLCITRTAPSRIRKDYGLKKTPIVWLTDMQTDKELVITPQLEQLLHLITDFIDKSGRSVILLDGLDYLINTNDFKRVLHFIHHLRDRIAISDSRLILPISPLTVDKKELKLLEREVDTVIKN